MLRLSGAGAFTFVHTAQHHRIFGPLVGNSRTAAYPMMVEVDRSAVSVVHLRRHSVTADRMVGYHDVARVERAVRGARCSHGRRLCQCIARCAQSSHGDQDGDLHSSSPNVDLKASCLPQLRHSLDRQASRSRDPRRLRTCRPSLDRRARAPLQARPPLGRELSHRRPCRMWRSGWSPCDRKACLNGPVARLLEVAGGHDR